jgi:hypothetical protein
MDTCSNNNYLCDSEKHGADHIVPLGGSSPFLPISLTKLGTLEHHSVFSPRFNFWMIAIGEKQNCPILLHLWMDFYAPAPTY